MFLYFHDCKIEERPGSICGTSSEKNTGLKNPASAHLNNSRPWDCLTDGKLKYDSQGVICGAILKAQHSCALPLHTMVEPVPNPSGINQWLSAVTWKPGASSLLEDHVICFIERICVEVSFRRYNLDFLPQST